MKQKLSKPQKNENDKITIHSHNNTNIQYRTQSSIDNDIPMLIVQEKGAQDE